jgi:hypothetical protein
MSETILCFEKGVDMMDVVLGPKPPTRNPFWACDLAFIDNEDGTYKLLRSKEVFPSLGSIDRLEMCKLIQRYL